MFVHSGKERQWLSDKYLIMATIERAPVTEVNQALHPMYNQKYSTLPKNPDEASALLRSYIPDFGNPITAQLSYGIAAIPNLVKNLFWFHFSKIN